MTVMLDRMVRAARLDPRLYEEVEADTGALAQAMGVVVLASFAGGLGSGRTGGPIGMGVAAVGALIGWAVWAGLTYVIGTKVLPEPGTRASPGELLRTIGFSSSPGVLRILGLIPGATGIVFFVCGAWMLVAMVVAVRQALDYRSTPRAVGVCAIGWAIQMILTMLALSVA